MSDDEVKGVPYVRRVIKHQWICPPCNNYQSQLFETEEDAEREMERHKRTVHRGRW